MNASVLCACFIVATAFPIDAGASGNSTTSSPAKPKIVCGAGPVKVLAYPFPPYLFGKDTMAFNTSGYATNPPLQGIMFDWVKSLLQRCLPLCRHPKPALLWKIVTSRETFIREVINGSVQYVLPISPALDESIANAAHAQPYYRTIVNSGGYYVIVDRMHINRYAQNQMLLSLAGCWPVFVLTFLLAGISGVLIWVMEVRANTDEFPASFARGSYEGFWWAFISMTTVGYGDKTPRSLAGRLFGVVWILLGLVVISMYTATITNAFSSLSNPSFTMRNKKLAVVEAAGDEAYSEVGYHQCIPYNYSSFTAAYNALKAEEVDGILIDKYQGAYYMETKKDTELRVMKTISSTNVLFKLAVNREQSVFPRDFECIHSQLENPSVNGLIKDYAPPGQEYFASVDSTSFLTVDSYSLRIALFGLTGLLAGLILIGVVGQAIYTMTHCIKVDCKDGSANDIKEQPLELMSTTFIAIDNTLQDLVRDVNKLRDLLANARQGTSYNT